MSTLPECDMVMKGGITSGVVYPTAVADLAERFRFRSLGGASAGAIAAAAAAAAEFNRDGGGFERLRMLPDELGQNLADLFQPSARLHGVFGLALETARTKRAPVRKLLALAAKPAMWVWYLVLGVALAISIVLFVVAGVWAGLFGVALTALLAVAIAVKVALDIVGLAREVVAAIDENNYGICDGHTAAPDAPAAPKPLTEWLYDLFNDVAGLDRDDPLTFGRLWGDAATNRYRQALERGEHNPPADAVVASREIDLVVMATNVSMARPYKLPFDVRMYMWCESCLGNYFNDDVLDHMKTCPTGGKVDEALTCPEHKTALWRVPAAPDLPVIVAVRISLSFPVLFSAVPLHTVDRNRRHDRQRAEICWFADGGISSNFPMHFFDAMWPSRPTFGISLGPEHPDFERMVYRPTRPGDGIHLRIADLGNTVDFLRGILNTMQNWADAMQQTVPGYRDRIVEIRTKDSEGGMNITMTAEQITRLAERGIEAAAEFGTFDFDTHQWIRYRTSTSEISKVFTDMRNVWSDERVPVQRFHEDDFEHTAYAPQSALWLRQDEEATEALMTTVDTWRDLDRPAERSSPPRPSPEFRITPRL
jgi:predicted acylesterase/phospholipase RssA